MWQDVLDSEAHHVYFKKFLESNNNAYRPWSFFLDVEELEKITDPNKRRKKVVAIIQTYFKKKGLRWFANAQAVFRFLL